MAKRARSNAGAWAIEEHRERLKDLIEAKLKAFEKASIATKPADLPTLHREFVLELGYAALSLTGRESLPTLFR